MGWEVAVLIDVGSRDQTNKMRKLNSSGLQNAVLYNLLRVPQTFHTSDNPMTIDESCGRRGTPDGRHQNCEVRCIQGTVSTAGAISLKKKK
jgi:hypothetical protein